MIKNLFFSTIILFAGIQFAQANNFTSNPASDKDSLRLAQLDLFWAELARTVIEGDHEGYQALYHEDAIVVFAAGKKKGSVSIADAMKGWMQGFVDTKAGKKKDHVEFRMSQRIGNETTAHETGIFAFTSADGEGNVQGKYLIHFEMLFVKKDDKWLAMMEHQKSEASEEEWNALK